MFNNKLFAKIIIFSLLFSLCTKAFCESTTPEPYDTDEFPTALKDIRRFEIITLGSMPFVMLDVEIGYAGYKFFTNDYDTSYLSGIFGTNSYTEEEQKKIILTSLGIGAGIGLVDFTVNKIKFAISHKNKKAKKTGNIEVKPAIPIDEDPDAIKINLPFDDEIEEDFSSQEDDFNSDTISIESDDEIQVVNQIIETEEIK